MIARSRFWVRGRTDGGVSRARGLRRASGQAPDAIHAEFAAGRSPRSPPHCDNSFRGCDSIYIPIAMRFIEGVSVFIEGLPRIRG